MALTTDAAIFRDPARPRPGPLLATAEPPAWPLLGGGIGAVTLLALLGVPASSLALISALGLCVAAPHGFRSSREVLERAGGLLLLVLCAPAMLAIAGCVKLYDRGPVLVQTPRSRADGRTYRSLSFRLRDQTTGELTGPGRALRRSSLNELPGLINVVRGDTELISWPPAPSIPVTVTDVGDPPYVVHVTEVLGGVETYLSLLVEHRDPSVRQGFVFAHDSSFADKLRARGHEVRVVPMPRTRTLWRELIAARQLRLVLREMRPDVVHLHSSQAGLVGRLAWARKGRSVVYTPHAFYYLGKRGLARRVFLLAEMALARTFPTYVLATSPSELVRAVRDVRVPAHRVVACTNGVDVPEAAAPRQLRDGPIRVGLVARVSPQKNVPMFLRTVARLQDDARMDVDCHFVGVGHYVDDLLEVHAMMGEAGVGPGSLILHPWMPREDLLTWLTSCDVLVLTSDYESFGYALAEATALGIPVVGTDIDGVRDVVLEGLNGFVVARDDDAAMAARIIDVVADPASYREMSMLCHAIAARRVNITGFIDQIEHFYATGEIDPARRLRSGSRPPARVPSGRHAASITAPYEVAT